MSDILTSQEREVFEWVEIDQNLCSRTYSSSPCVAVKGTTGPDKCFNTRSSCQDPDNFDGSEILTLYFCPNQSRIPDDHQYEPYLISSSVSPATINPGGGNKSAIALGTRGVLSVTLADHPHTDSIVDPYVADRDYNPYDRSTFWAKWRARNPYYMHRVIRHNSAYLDPDTGLPDEDTKITRTFFITDFQGPNSSGTVAIKGKDLLTIAQDEKAKVPAASTGRLLAGIDAVTTAATLTPTGVGNDEYPASGKLRIGDEVCSFTRAADVLTLVRGSNNTDAETHDADDAVQLCFVVTSDEPQTILFELLTTYAGIDASYLNTEQWAIESTEFLPRLYSGIITTPTGVTSIINELCEQMYFTTYWDDRNMDLTASPKEGGLKMMAVRPAFDEPVYELNDESNLLENSVTWTDKADQLITHVFVYYAQRDPTKKLDETSNYGALEIVGDADSAGAARNDGERIKIIFARWLDSGDGAAAIELGEKILARYSNIPKECKFSVDAKDRAMRLADFISITNRQLVDFWGEPQAKPMQIISEQESKQGTTYTYKAIEYAGTYIETNPDELTISIAADMWNVSLLDLFQDNYAVTPISGDKIKFTIRSGVTVGGIAREPGVNLDTGLNAPTLSRVYDANYSVATPTLETPYLQRDYIAIPREFVIGATYLNADTSAPEGTATSLIKEIPLSTALTVGDTGTWPTGWPAGVELTLVIEANAMVLGEGGASAYHRLESGLPQVLAGDGGHAMDVGHPITIENYGIIGGAGGGGTATGRTDLISTNPSDLVMGGGGGAGYDNGLTRAYLLSNHLDNSANLTSTPSDGDKNNNGYGAATLQFLGMAKSGDGGALGEDGGVVEAVTSIIPGIPSTIEIDMPGKAGDAVVSGSSNITWKNRPINSVIGAEN